MWPPLGALGAQKGWSGATPAAVAAPDAEGLYVWRAR